MEPPLAPELAPVSEMLERLMAALLRDQPAMPAAYMREYVQRERDGVPHPEPRAPTPTPEAAPPPPRPAPPPRRSGAAAGPGAGALPLLNSYYAELLRGKWFSAGPASAGGGSAAAAAAESAARGAEEVRCPPTQPR